MLITKTASMWYKPELSLLGYVSDLMTIWPLVHSNPRASQVRDYPRFLNELAEVLRPGGVLLLGDGDMQVFDENKRPIAYAEEGHPGFSWTQRIFFAAYNAMKNKGGSVDSPSMNPTWLREIKSFTDVGWHKVFIPIGPWCYGAPCSF